MILIRIIIFGFVSLCFTGQFSIGAVAAGLGGDVDVAAIWAGGVFGDHFGDNQSAFGDDGIFGRFMPAAAGFGKGDDAFALVIGLEHPQIFVCQFGQILAENEAVFTAVKHVNVVRWPAVATLITVADGQIFTAIKVEIIENQRTLLIIELNDVDGWRLLCRQEKIQIV